MQPKTHAVPDPRELRSAAAEALGAIGSPIATKHLVRALERTFDIAGVGALRIRQDIVAESLLQIGDEAATEILIRGTKQWLPHSKQWESAVRAFGQFQNSKVLPHLLQLFLQHIDDSSAMVKVANALAAIGSEEAVDRLGGYITSNRQIRRYAPEVARCLGQIMSHKAIPYLENYAEFWRCNLQKLEAAYGRPADGYQDQKNIKIAEEGIQRIRSAMRNSTE